jgi:hypothetical protein
VSVDAGSVNSSIRIKLDQLNADIIAVKSAFDNLGTELKNNAANYSNIAGKQYQAALKKIADETKNVSAAAKAGALSEKDAVSRLLQLRQQELAILQKRAIAEQGTNKATVDAIKSSEKAVISLIEKQKLLEKATVPAGTAMMNSFRNLQSVMQGPVAAANAIIGTIKMIASEADRLIMKASESEKAQAILNSTIAATGANAWTSRSKLNEYANQMAKVTLFEDDAITSMQTVLLGFKNIQGVNFEKASTEILNMSQVMGMDLASAAQAVGKALDDPITGIDSLSRQGFKFSEEQKKVLKVMVETGDIAGAQNIILKELSTTYGGAAAAAAETATGKYQNLKKSLGDVTEELGKAISASGQWSELGGFMNNLSDGIERLNKMGSLKEKIKEIQDLMGTRGFMSAGLSEQNKQISKFGLTVDDIGSTILIMKDRIAELKDENKYPWNPIVYNNGEIKKLETQIAAAQSLIPIIKEADRYNNKKASDDKKNADEEAKRNEEQLARFEKAAEEKKKRDEADKKAEEEKKKAYEDERKAFSDSMEKSRERYKNLDQQIQLLGKTEKQQQELKHKWEIESIQNANITDEQKAAEIAKLNVLYEKQKQITEADANKALAVTADDYKSKLEELNGVEKDSIELQRKKAIASALASGASADDIKMAVDAINLYYDALTSKDKTEKVKKTFEGISKSIGSVSGYLKDVLSAINDAIQASYDKQIEAAENAADAQEKIMDKQHEAETDALDAEAEHKIELIENDGMTHEEYLKKKVDDAISAGDAEAQADAEKQLILYQTEQEYDAKKKDLADQQEAETEARDKAAAKAKANLEYQAAMASWRIKLAIAISDGIAAVINAIATTPGEAIIKGLAGAATGALVGIQIAAISKSMPTPPALATGGIILPQSGGVTATMAENGYGELALNAGPSGDALLETFANKIANAIGKNQSSQPTLYVQNLFGDDASYRELIRKMESLKGVETARRG